MMAKLSSSSISASASWSLVSSMDGGPVVEVVREACSLGAPLMLALMLAVDKRLVSCGRCCGC